jgi:acyl-CoA reductase-like NAD-dependent aldehyde dehydrogenase
MTNALQHTISPYTQGVVYTRQLCSINDIDAALDKASAAQQAWRRTSLEARQDVVRRWTEEMASRGDEIGRDLALQMGRYIHHN